MQKFSTKFLYECAISAFLPGIAVCPACGSKGQCKLHAYYGRNIIDFTGGKRHQEKVTVPRMMCGSCGHTHAVLPDVLVPYSSYSLLFILRVLADVFLLNHTQEKVCEDYEISMKLLRKWIRLWREHKLLWLGLLKDAEISDRDFLDELRTRDECSGFLHAFYEKSRFSFLQGHREPDYTRHRKARFRRGQ